jgi:hypothetical protein
MKLKLAKSTLKSKSKTIELEKIEEMLPEKSIFYFDRENEHKDMKALIEYFEERDYSVYMKEVRYGLNDDEYIYEVHIIK